MSKSGLDKWFSEKWVDVSKDGDHAAGHAPCGRSDADSKKGYPKCVPASKARSMSDKDKKSATRRKRYAEKNKKRDGKKPINVSTEKKSMFEEGYARTMKVAGLADAAINVIMAPAGLVTGVAQLPSAIRGIDAPRRARKQLNALIQDWNLDPNRDVKTQESMLSGREYPEVRLFGNSVGKRKDDLYFSLPFDERADNPFLNAAAQYNVDFQDRALAVNKALQEAEDNRDLLPRVLKGLARDATITAGMGLGGKAIYDKVTG